MIIEMLRMIWFSICWIWCIPRCLKLIKLISENLSNKPYTGQPSVIHIDLKWFGKLRLWVFWTEVISDIAHKISFFAHCSPFWVSLWKLLWSSGRTTTRQSRLHRNSFSKSSLFLTPHSSLRLQIHNCDSDTAPEIEASGLVVDPQRAVAAAEERRSRAGKLRRA